MNAVLVLKGRGLRPVVVENNASCRDNEYGNRMLRDLGRATPLCPVLSDRNPIENACFTLQSGLAEPSFRFLLKVHALETSCEGMGRHSHRSHQSPRSLDRDTD